MGLKTFKGGVHPKDGKDLSKAKPIKGICRRGIWSFGVTAHRAPAVPIVAVGDIVKKGQKDCRGGRVCLRTGLQFCLRYGQGDRA